MPRFVAFELDAHGKRTVMCSKANQEEVDEILTTLGLEAINARNHPQYPHARVATLIPYEHGKPFTQEDIRNRFSEMRYDVWDSFTL